MTERLRIVVGGYLGLLPAGGVTWDYLQYPLGLAELGQDVYYIEDTGLWPVWQDNADSNQQSATNVRHLESVMTAFGLADRWAYRDAVTESCFGLTEQQVLEICRTADVFINVSCATRDRDEYNSIPVRALIDSDPMFTQMRLEAPEQFPAGNPKLPELVSSYTHLFSFGENIGRDDCLVPTCGFEWIPTRQPVCLDHWPVSPLPPPTESAYTTVMNWSADKPIDFRGERWGQKNVEWMKLLELPSGANASLAVAVTDGNTDAAFPKLEAERNGWQVMNPNDCVADWESYRKFINQSRAELSVAKNTYVKSNSGWFSCRSACYLAAGRPVIAQNTGWSKFYPHDKGLFAFSSAEEAVNAIEQIESDPDQHAVAARNIACEYFDARKVLTRLLQNVGA